MPFGATVTSFLTSFSADDHLAPQVVSNFVGDLPPNPVKGAAVSAFAQDLYPIDPIHPAGLGQQLSAFIHLLGPDTGTNGDTF